MTEKKLKPSESRRGFIRVDLKPSTFVCFSDGIQFRGIDLTVYGISFLTTPEESLRFQVGSLCEGVHFTLSGRTVTVESSRIAHVQRQPGARCKVAIEFIEIPVEDVFFLSKYVSDQIGIRRVRNLKIKMPVTKKKATKKTAKKTAGVKSRARPKATKKKKSSRSRR